MLRMMILACALAAPGMAVADELPASSVGLEIRADDGTIQGRVEHAVRNGEGRVVAVDVSGLEAPGDAPGSADDLVAENEGWRLPAAYSVTRQSQVASNSGARADARLR
ncbi:MAG: hypothetical protein WDM79_10640 [Terricaulis sp.]